VTAVDLAGQESEPSAIAISNGGNPDHFFHPHPPTAPSGLTGTGGQPALLTWNANAHEEQVVVYRVYYSSSAEGPYTLLGEVSGTSYTISTLPESGEYWFYVTAVNRAGESDRSPTISLQVSAPSQGDIQVPDNSETQSANQS
jgi:fibronectin type 3 domain-containing protein